MYILEGKVAEYFASLHEREPDLPYYGGSKEWKLGLLSGNYKKPHN